MPVRSVASESEEKEGVVEGEEELEEDDKCFVSLSQRETNVISSTFSALHSCCSGCRR